MLAHWPKVPLFLFLGRPNTHFMLPEKTITLQNISILQISIST